MDDRGGPLPWDRSTPEARTSLRPPTRLTLPGRPASLAHVEIVGLGFPLDGDVDGEELARLGVSAQLIERLRSWQEGWEARVEIAADPLDLMPGRPLSVRLARQLQSELPAHDVYLDIAGTRHAARDLAP